MSKEKIFKPEDFDKPTDKTFWQKYKRWILGIGIATLIIIVVIVICSILCGKERHKEKVVKQEQTEQVSTNPVTACDTNTIERVETETIEYPQEVVSVEPITSPEPRNQLPDVSYNLEQEAMNVIRGNYGNVPERRDKLGSKFQEIQNRVNQLKREGAF